MPELRILLMIAKDVSYEAHNVRWRRQDSQYAGESPVQGSHVLELSHSASTMCYC